MNPSIAINPTRVVMVGLDTLTFVATLSDISGSVVWAVDGIVDGNSTVGTIAAGVYTAPAETGLHSVTATVTSGPDTVFATASVNVQAYSPAGIATLTFGTHLTGTSFNGSTPKTIATDATSSNTAGTIVARDSSGNFAAGKATLGAAFFSTLPPVYANNAAAITGGLTAGAVYRTGADPDFIAVVH